MEPITSASTRTIRPIGLDSVLMASLLKCPSRASRHIHRVDQPRCFFRKHAELDAFAEPGLLAFERRGVGPGEIGRQQKYLRARPRGRDLVGLLQAEELLRVFFEMLLVVL